LAKGNIITIQHRLIPDAELHEPKGASGAALGTVYVSTGGGTGVWKKVGADVLQGLSGDGSVAGLKAITNGSNGFVLRADNAYGAMSTTNNTNNFAVTAAGDTTLNTNSDFVVFTGTGAPWSGENIFGATFNTDRITVLTSGVYAVKVWAQVSGFPSNVTFIGAKFKVNGATYSPRVMKVKSNAGGDYGLISGFEYLTLAANDYVQLAVASSVTGNLVVQNMNLTVELVRAT
jgi:hypothetical protein